MDAGVARRLAQGVKTHKRKDASTSGSMKKARTEWTSLAAPALMPVVVEAPSDVKLEVSQAPSQSPPAEGPISEVRPEGAPGAEGRKRKKTLVRRSRSRKVAIEGTGSSKEDLRKNPFNNRNLIKRLVEGCILPEVVKRIVLADPELRVWDSLGSFLEIS